MAKVQKSFMVHEDLDRLTKILEERTGGSFTRIMHAALFAYFFESFKSAEPASGHAPDPLWMRLAVLVERGELEVGDAPTQLLDAVVETCQVMLAGDTDETSDLAKGYRQRIKDAKQIRRGWENRIADFGGKIGALVETIESQYKQR